MNKIDEEERQRIIDEKSENISNLLCQLLPKEQVQSMSNFRKRFKYVIISISLFILFIFFLCRNIIFLRWKKIPNEFRVLGLVDDIIKNHLEI